MVRCKTARCKPACRMDTLQSKMEQISRPPQSSYVRSTRHNQARPAPTKTTRISLRSYATSSSTAQRFCLEPTPTHLPYNRAASRRVDNTSTSGMVGIRTARFKGTTSEIPSCRYTANRTDTKQEDYTSSPALKVPCTVPVPTPATAIQMCTAAPVLAEVLPWVKTHDGTHRKTATTTATITVTP